MIINAVWREQAWVRPSPNSYLDRAVAECIFNQRCRPANKIREYPKLPYANSGQPSHNARTRRRAHLPLIGTQTTGLTAVNTLAEKPDGFS
jgi:hypothetical protein